MGRARALAMGFVLATGFLGAQDPPAPRASAVIRPCDDCVPGVINFARISDALWRGAQPTAEGFRSLERMGAKTIVSFRHDHDDLPMLKGTRLKYLRIPSRAYRPELANLSMFLKVVEDPANWPVYIHCAQGRDRTGYNAAVYRMAAQGWDAEAAIREMGVFHFNRVWMGNPGFLRKLDIEALKAAARDTPMPELRSAEP